jgi:GNAT superfamily N-acetyltransferase
MRSLPFTAPDSVAMITELMADLARRYGGTGDDTPIAAADFEPPRGDFLVAFLDGTPVGCGAWRTFAGAEGLAEIKRMYVVPALRGTGLARAVLAGVEDSARKAGCRRAILETGDGQPEAIAFYRKAGYRPIENFGHYKDEPGARSFGRDLDA